MRDWLRKYRHALAFVTTLALALAASANWPKP
jgi:hypothetical protein